MKANILVPYADQVSNLAMDVFDLLAKHEVPYAMMALLLNIDFILKKIVERGGCPEKVITEAGQLREQIRGLTYAIARNLKDTKGKTNAN